MREIKFRGWHNGAKDMVYFGLGEDNIQCEGEDGEKFKFMIKDGHPVMQYTGLKDKNGEEIYEGDVVEIELSAERAFGDGKSETFRIEIFFGKDASFHGRRIGIPTDLYSVGSSGSAVVRKEVIGNIYENPELLNA